MLQIAQGQRRNPNDKPENISNLMKKKYGVSKSVGAVKGGSNTKAGPSQPWLLPQETGRRITH